MRDTIEIRSLEPSIRKDGKDYWPKVEITFNGDERSKREICLRDPFSEEERGKWFKWYLEGSWKPDSGTSKLKHNENLMDAANQIKKYRDCLFEQLDLDSGLAHERRGIFICEENVGKPEGRSFHSISWELLEDLSLWTHPPRPSRVGITHIYTRKKDVGENDHAPTGHTSGPFKLLLVIARSWRQDRDRIWQDVWPHIVQLSLCRILEQLRMRGLPNKLEVEVVRPGTFRALEEHLSNDDDRPFDLVHFDLHGVIQLNPEGGLFVPMLRFAQPYPLNKARPEYDDVPAGDVAKSLGDRGIRQVVLNSCSSASGENGPQANMSRHFIEHGVLNVSAMSYKIHDAAVSLYHEAFYEAFFLHDKDFREAASIGRSALRANTKRDDSAERDDSMVPINASHSRDDSNNMRRLLFLENQVRQRQPLFDTLYAGLALLFAFGSSTYAFMWIGPWWSAILVLSFLIFLALRKRIRWSTWSIPAALHLGDVRVFVRRVRLFYQSGTQDYKPLRLDIRILALEDSLKTRKMLYLYGPKHVDNAELIHRVANLWLLTNFISQVHAISATRFLLSPLQYWVRRAMGVFCHDEDLPKCTAHQPRPSARRGRERRGVLVIKDFHSLYDEGVSESSRKTAFGRISAYLDKDRLSRNYVIIIGIESQHVGSKVWWLNEQWEEAEKRWGAATPHFHGQELPAYSTYHR